MFSSFLPKVRRIYISCSQEHPEARSFRIKSIPYYNDLCIIYGGATVGQKGNHLYFDNIIARNYLVVLFVNYGSSGIYSQESSHSGDNETMYTKPLGTASEGDVEALNGIMIGEDYKISVSGDVDELPQMSTTATTAISRSRTYWQPPMDRFFIDLMLEQVQKGNQIDGIFRKHSWAEMIASFNAKFGFNYDVDVLKNRYKTLRRQYNVIKNLLDLDGFLWDETRQMITADDYIWQDYIKVSKLHISSTILFLFACGLCCLLFIDLHMNMSAAVDHTELLLIEFDHKRTVVGF